MTSAARARGQPAPAAAWASRLDGYFYRQRDHLGDPARLAEGRSIGSGLVEGASKQVIGRRLKQTGARWRIRRANRMASLCCTLHGDTWKTSWDHRFN